ncbi:type II secretion system secretin GspD [Aestuariibius sp. 2305UL40-4]|uniref:type II secretion system secretin GspD n=1 Tax=Aestuariibius violaceus TaxID=3234132 RepID=UPI00345EFAF8
MKKTIPWIGVVLAMAGCEALNDDDLASQRVSLFPWQRDIIEGNAGDFGPGERRQGRVLPAQSVEAGDGTIFPGRQPLVRQDDFVTVGSSGQTVSLTLVDVSIEEAANAILGEVLRQNFVIDPRVSGTVNIRSAEPISRATAIEVFELALRQNNAALIRRGEVFAIVPLTSDLAIGASTGRDIPPGYSFRVVPLRNIGAQEMAAILQPFAGSGIVGIDAQRNIIVLAGTSGDQRAWQETIDSFDVDWLANKSVGIFPIRGRSAQSIVNGLEQIVETDEQFEPIAVFEVIPENNSILAVAKTPRALQNVAVWISRLTQEGQNDAQVYSYDMKYARASTVAPTLSQVLGISVVTAEGEGEAEVILASDTGEMTQGNLGTQNETRVVANEATNTLLIHATREEYNRIVGILHRLDVPPRQVLVEATIVEVTLTDDLRYGVQFLFSDGDARGGLTRGGSASISAETPGFFVTLDSPADVIVDALADETQINVISSPNLMILNNESARLLVGDQVPVATQQATDVNADEDVFISTVEFRDTGVIFDVTPRINSSGAVTLDIVQEVSNVREADAETLTPTISQRIVDSSISVNSGETIVLGGLFSNTETRGNSGVPGLKDIPVAGKLFGRTRRDNARTELIVLITPRIVNDAMDARRVTQQLRRRVTALQQPSLSTDVRVPALETENSSKLGQFIETPTPAAPATQAQPTQVAASGATDHYAILGAFSTREAAERHWSTLRSNYPALARQRAAFTATQSLTTVSVGPMTRAEATQVCVTVQTECFTAKRR